MTPFSGLGRIQAPERGRIAAAPENGEYAGLSYWHATAGDDLTPRPPLAGDGEVDVAIVGGGLTGLWTAWYLLERDPSLRITVLEAEIAGFGASGRNGGWCSALFPQSTAALERRHGRDAALAMRRAMIDTVDEVGRAATAAGLGIDYAKGGTIVYARDEAQRRSAEQDVRAATDDGVDPLEWWGPDRVRASGRGGQGSALGAAFDPNCARIHPAKLVRGLARALERRGVRIAEQTRVLSWRGADAPDRRGAVVFTDHGVLRADRIVIALEGYTATVPQARRRMIPLYSLMIATEPLPDAVWDEIGLAHGHTFSDYRHLIVYGQRTADNRFAFGGRGAPYHFGSRIKAGYDRDEGVFRHLAAALHELFPQLPADLAVTHTWGGALGVPRDWHAHAAFDPATRIASAGGYVGDGLSTTNLAGRTMADLLTGIDSELTRLPWVGHRSPDWEPEPWRWLGTNAGTAAMAIADREESLTGRPAVSAKLLAPLIGH